MNMNLTVLKCHIRLTQVNRKAKGFAFRHQKLQQESRVIYIYTEPKRHIYNFSVTFDCVRLKSLPEYRIPNSANKMRIKKHIPQTIPYLSRNPIYISFNFH
jgi:hypothetical protein